DQFEPINCAVIPGVRDETERSQLPVWAQPRAVVGDIREKETWESLLKGTDIVFHLAGQTSHYRANQHPEEDWQINCLPVLIYAQVVSSMPSPPRFVFASTATVHGLTTVLPCNEEQRERPITFYDIHKVTSEHYLYYLAQEKHWETASLRLANVYGFSRSGSHLDR